MASAELGGLVVSHPNLLLDGGEDFVDVDLEDRLNSALRVCPSQLHTVTESSARGSRLQDEPALRDAVILISRRR